MNNFSCPNCKAARYSQEFPYRGSAPGFVNRKILKCAVCGLASVSPMPENLDLENYYKNYWTGKEEDELLPLFIAQADSRYDFIAKHLPNKKILDIIDVGAGFGLIRRAFPVQVNYDVVEVDPHAVSYLHSNIHPERVYADCAQIQSDYDVTIMAHILEHLRDPLGFLLSQREHVRNNGLVFIEVPNLDFVFKSRNEPHLIFFELTTLSELVAKAGFVVLRADTCGEPIEAMRASRDSIIRKGILAKVLANLKWLTRGILPAEILQKVIKVRAHRQNSNAAIYASTYGGARRWIRLLAVKQ